MRQYERRNWDLKRIWRQFRLGAEIGLFWGNFCVPMIICEGWSSSCSPYSLEMRSTIWFSKRGALAKFKFPATLSMATLSASSEFKSWEKNIVNPLANFLLPLKRRKSFWRKFWIAWSIFFLFWSCCVAIAILLAAIIFSAWWIFHEKKFSTRSRKERKVFSSTTL